MSSINGLPMLFSAFISHLGVIWLRLLFPLSRYEYMTYVMYDKFPTPAKSNESKNNLVRSTCEMVDFHKEWISIAPFSFACFDGKKLDL